MSGKGGPSGEPIPLSRILEHWPLLESDFQSEYAIDLSDPAIRHGKAWRWFLVRLHGLLAADTRLFRALAPRENPSAETPDNELDEP